MANDLKSQSIRNLEYYGLVETYDELYEKSKSGREFTHLMELITAPENIMLAYRSIKGNSGSRTPGVDGKTITSLSKLTQEEFVQKIQNKLSWFTPNKVKRVEIPKPNGKTRPLGIPSITDRVIQQAILQVLEPICEAKFYEASYGFRPNRSAEHAIAKCMNLIQVCHNHYVVDIDIQGFFDNVDHSKLIRQLWAIGIRDKKLLSIIKAMLKAPIVMPNGETVIPDKGTPQGGILSPLLANVVLNELDWWISSQWENIPTEQDLLQYKPNKAGGIDRSYKYSTLRNKTMLKEMYLVRYADDFKIFCKTRSDANKIFIATKKWLKERLGLEISQEKSRVTNLKKSRTEFLGFELKVHPKAGKMVVESRITQKAKKRMAETLRSQIKEIQHAGNFVAEVNKYNSMVIGMHNYYNIATNSWTDFTEIARQIHQAQKRLNLTKSGNKSPHSVIYQEYGKSAQIRFFNGMPIAPIGYCKTKTAMNKNRKINKYTPEGRILVHNMLTINLNAVRNMMQTDPKGSRSIQYCDNRIALYVAQNGKCAITGKYITGEEVHCHHKIPRENGGTDDYENLIIVSQGVHKLIHATNTEVIEKYLTEITDKSQLEKLNALRKMANCEPLNKN